MESSHLIFRIALRMLLHFRWGVKSDVGWRDGVGASYAGSADGRRCRAVSYTHLSNTPLPAATVFKTYFGNLILKGSLKGQTMEDVYKRQLEDRLNMA